VPLETAAMRGIEPGALRESMQHWDRWAVELGRFRDVAMAQGGVATDRDALPTRSGARTTLEGALGSTKRVRAAAIVHLVVRERIIAALIVMRHRDVPFDARDVATLRAIAPALAVGDALHQRLDETARASMPVRLVCLDDRLTERQRLIVEHVALGHTNAQIAEALGVSPNTVRNLLVRVFERIGASNRADVVRLAVLRPGG
jgi:DNA-binding CsgD family transcriptional regulator